MKVGGDKGGGKFKMTFQIMNVQHPNNTCAFCISEAPDNPANLKIALDRYGKQIGGIDTKKRILYMCILQNIYKQGEASKGVFEW